MMTKAEAQASACNFLAKTYAEVMEARMASNSAEEAYSNARLLLTEKNRAFDAARNDLFNLILGGEEPS